MILEQVAPGWHFEDYCLENLNLQILKNGVCGSMLL